MGEQEEEEEEEEDVLSVFRPFFCPFFVLAPCPFFVLSIRFVIEGTENGQNSGTENGQRIRTETGPPNSARGMPRLHCGRVFWVFGEGAIVASIRTSAAPQPSLPFAALMPACFS